ncbi:MAG: PspA/IM30 family protein [Verrucomicrobiales bacterium]|nr:PspA/IM30 family protein [Verrucomicrobiales bacterium]
MFRRLKNLIKGFFGLFVSGLEKKNPEALLEVEKENLREQISKFNRGLSAHAAVCEKLMSQVKTYESQETELRAKTVANLRAGNKELAGQFALKHQGVKKDMEESRQQLENAEKTYKDLLSARDTSVKAARDKIEGLKRDISDMKIQSAVAELNEMAAGMVNEIGGSGDTLNRLSEMVKEEKEKAAGRARVARDSIDMTEIHAKAGEQRALEDLALADFAAAEGIALEGASASGPTGTDAPAEKTMGPAQTN